MKHKSVEKLKQLNYDKSKDYSNGQCNKTLDGNTQFSSAAWLQPNAINLKPVDQFETYFYPRTRHRVLYNKVVGLSY